MNVEINGARIIATFENVPLFGTVQITQTLVVSWLILILISALFIWLGSGLKVTGISRKQAVAETIYTSLVNFVRGNMGSEFDRYIPLVGTIFVTSIISNLISLVGIWSPTADLMTELAWALVVFVLITYHKIKASGIGAYLKGFLDPIFILAPINVMSELFTPVSMACRHFGNILSGTVISALIYAALVAANNALFHLLASSMYVALAVTVVGLIPLIIGFTKKKKKLSEQPSHTIHYGFIVDGAEVIDEVLELLMDLNATPEQLDSPMLFCSGRQGTASYSPDVVGTDLTPLFETILEYIPAPEADVDQPFQMLVSSIDYNEFVGRIAVGRIERGTLKQNQEIMVCNYHDPDATPKKAKAVSIYEFEGLARKQVTESTAGNIIAMSGIPDITIGDTVCAPGAVEPLPFVKISAPTLEMTFSVNDSPYAGREGKFVTSRQLRDRLYRETLKDVSLKVSDTDRDSAFNVAGRGEMSLSILIETMRREGYEFQVSPPRVLYKEIDGKKCEPIERLVVDVPGDCVGSVIEKLGQRKGDLVEMTPVGDRMKVEFLIPARGLFGYRNDFLTDTKGEGIMASVFDSYAPYKGDISRRGMGSLISTETGDSITYGLFNAQERGTLFIGAGVPVYEGMIIGVANRGEDIVVNACRKKQLTNTRASGSDDALRLVPPRQMSLEQCLEFLADDELLEVTPKSLRMRKAILNHEQRMKSLKGKK